MGKLKIGEQETRISIMGDERAKKMCWDVYPDDPVMLGRLDKIAKPYKRDINGAYYKLEFSQVSLRNRKKTMSDADKAKLAARLAKGRKSSSV